jgi:hypothetical protein
VSEPFTLGELCRPYKMSAEADPPRLRRFFAQLLIQLNLQAEGSAAPIGRNGSSGSKPGSMPPPPVEAVAHKYLRLYLHARTVQQRLDVVSAAQEELERARFGPPAAKVRGTHDWKVAIATDQRPSAAVAVLYDISPGYVRKLRHHYKKNTLGAA